jgi:DNA-binding NtrC family response regulator
MIAAAADVKKSSIAAANGEKEALVDSSSWNSPGQARTDSAPMASARLVTKETVLLMDTAPMMRGVLARVLRQLGYRVMEASSALEAQSLAANRGEVHLLFMDVAGNDPGDIQLAVWFHGMYPKTRILVASGSMWDLNYQIGESHQITFLAKPYTSHELGRIIRRILK